MTTEDIPVNTCPICSGVFPEGVEFTWTPQTDENTCPDCTPDMRGIDR